jgi:hypothetical protein
MFIQVKFGNLFYATYVSQIHPSIPSGSTFKNLSMERVRLIKIHVLTSEITRQKPTEQ